MSATPSDWTGQALCAQTDPELFFPEKGQPSREAKATCLRCPVRVACLDWALEHDERFGVWGGISERQRRELRRRGVSAVQALALVADGDLGAAAERSTSGDAA